MVSDHPTNPASPEREDSFNGYPVIYRSKPEDMRAGIVVTEGDADN